MKNQTLMFAGVGLVAALLFLKRPAMAAAPLSIQPATAWVPKSLGTITAGQAPYQPARTNTAATLPYGFQNVTPGGEFINGFV